jgi:hypothetical protein
MNKDSGTGQDPADKARASLVDKESGGGGIALRGFDFQRSYALILLIESIKDPNWNAVLVEGAEDVEISFNRQGRVEHRAIQLKNHRVTTAMAKGIVGHFEKLDKDSPGTWTEFVLACTELDPTLKTIHNGLERYRPLRPGIFYDKDDFILVNTRDEVGHKIEDADLPVEFVLERVTFESNLQSFANEEWVRGRALDLLQQAYPGVNHAAAERIYLRLRELVSESTGKAITRQAIEVQIQAEFDKHTQSVVNSRSDIDYLLRLFTRAAFLKMDGTGGDPTAMFSAIRETRFAMGDKPLLLFGNDVVARGFQGIHQQLYKLEHDTWEKYPQVAALADNREIVQLSKYERTTKVRAALGDDKSDQASAFLRLRAVEIRDSVEKLVGELKKLQGPS